MPRVVSVDVFRSPDGQVELDAVARTMEGETWVVEVKWGGRQVSQRDLKWLQAKVEKVELGCPVRLWVISRSGFSQEAHEYARRSGTLLTDRPRFEALARVVNGD